MEKPKPAVSKKVLLLYKTENEKMSDLVDHFCNALNQVNPPGCVAIERKNAVNLFGQDEQKLKKRMLQWLANPNCVAIALLFAGDPNDAPREFFADESGILPNKIFPVCFGTHDCGECNSFGLANPEKIERPNDFESAGFNTLVAGIRGT